MFPNGLIRVFTGQGKGKTTAAVGLAVQAVANGTKVYMVQMLKGPETTGEQMAAKALGPMFTIAGMGRKGLVRSRMYKPIDYELARQALEKARVAMLCGEYGMVIVDEANVAVYKGLIDVQDLLGLLEVKPQGVDLILTGRNAHPEVMAMANSVLEMTKVKHHFEQGIKAREGIEY
jgi:cob(I)alamin adenosyltransferase